MVKISEERIASYQATLYRVTGIVPAFTLRIGEYSAALATVYRDTGHVNAAYITAWNPRSQPFPNDINEDRQRRLIACLEERGNRYFFGEGSSPDGMWREQSLLVLGIDLALARALSEQFEQNAFVYCDEGAVPQLVLLR